jgi:hypothetical protein
MTTADARYSHSSGDHNRLLLLALVQAWGNKCYWCRTPTSFRDLQIDHIIPKKPHGGGTADFDVDGPANLAPICGPCNQEKGNRDYRDDPRIASQMRAAATAAPKVQGNLVRFHKDGAVVQALLAVTAADVESEDVAEALESFGALILPVFRQKFPQILDAPYTQAYTRRRPPVVFEGRQVQLPQEQLLVELDVQSRRALIVLEDVLDIPMLSALNDIQGYFATDIDEQVKSLVRRGKGGRYSDADVEDRPSSNPIGVYVYDLRYSNGEVTLTGALDGVFAAHFEEDAGVDFEELGRPTTSRSAYFDFIGHFSVTYSRDGLIDAHVDVDADLDEVSWRRLIEPSPDG